MNDFLKTLGQFGMEGLGLEDEGRELSLEEEMNEEIAMEAALDEAYAQMDFANMVASASRAESLLTTMADREVGLESNIGRDVTAVYKGFGIEVGMEAVKDVVARKAYSGLASIKALINTCIKWLKSLIGIHTASKKIFAGLKKKATAMKKQLSKVQSKVSEKLKRELPDYARALTAFSYAYAEAVKQEKEWGNTQSASAIEAIIKATASKDVIEQDIKDVDSNISDLKDLSEKSTDYYDKSDTTEYEGSACYNKIFAVVKSIETIGNNLKSDDYVKIIDKNIKTWEKVRKSLDNDKNYTQPANLSRYINKEIELLTKASGFLKKCLKSIVSISDDALTMAKGIYATLV